MTAVDRYKTHVVRLLIFIKKGEILKNTLHKSKKRGTFRVHKICEIAKKG